MTPVAIATKFGRKLAITLLV